MKLIFLEELNKLFQIRPMISLLSLIVLFIIFKAISKKSIFNARTLAYGAMAIAASFVLSYVKIVEFPNGGSITIASMLPIFMFAYIAGPRAGLAAGLCYGMLQYIQEPFFVHWTQFLLDYPIAYSMLGLAGIFRKNPYMGAVVGSTGRFIFHFLSGIIFFASSAGDQNVFVFSFTYNISYILPDMLICMSIMAVPKVRVAISNVKNAAA